MYESCDPQILIQIQIRYVISPGQAALAEWQLGHDRDLACIRAPCLPTDPVPRRYSLFPCFTCLLSQIPLSTLTLTSSQSHTQHAILDSAVERGNNGCGKSRDSYIVGRQEGIALPHDASSRKFPLFLLHFLVIFFRNEKIPKIATTL